MKEVSRHFIGLFTCATCVFTPGALAQPSAFSYQGRLNDGGLPAGGMHDFQFRLFDSEDGGAQIGLTQCIDNLLVAQGMFMVTLDFGPQFSTPGQRFIEVAVRKDTGLTCAVATGFQPLSPRQLVSAVPLAMHANSAFSLAAADGAPANVVFVNNNGNVGVGTTTPAAKLHIGSGDMLAGPPGEEWIFHTRSSFGGDFLHITDSDAGVFQFQRGLTLDESGNVGLRNANGTVLATGGVENVRIIRGGVRTDGTTLSGAGFSSRKLVTGTYIIDFETFFQDPPATTVTAKSISFTTRFIAQVSSNSHSGLLIEIFTTDGTLIDCPFSFIAIGGR